MFKEGACFMSSRFFPVVCRAGLVRPMSLSVLAGLLSCGLAACSGGVVPSQYLKQAEPGVTLTKLSKDPAAYRGKVVVLGGVIVDEKQGDNRVWLHVKNRPLDDDYVPHIPVTKEGPEAGHYWVMVWKKDLPKDYQNFSRITVVGRLMGGKIAFDENASDERIQNVILSALYLRGWGKDFGGYITESDDSGFVRAPVAPKSLQKNTTQ
jgi:starvation-inducible outer membrane lipoprotein